MQFYKKIIIVIICLVGFIPARQLFAQDTTNIVVKDSLTTPKDSIKTIVPLTAKEIKQHKRDSIKIVRDSLKIIRDSIRLAKPRILKTPSIPDSLYYKRILTWSNDTYFNRLNQNKLDTTFNEWYSEYPFYKEDINATYLGVIGSATQNYNYFKYKKLEVAQFYSPYMAYSSSPEDQPYYNTKSPYTELAYWGTILASKNKEEANIKILHTQNITPEFNFALLYQKYGGKGLLEREDTDNRTFSLTGNYLGKKYTAHGGFIHHRIKRLENGGVKDTKMVLDTILDSKVIEINLKEASNNLLRNTFYINHTYGIPIRFKKGDTTAIGDGTMAYIGHYGEYSYYSKSYKDMIATNDQAGRNFYDNKFYINPTTSSDSLSINQFENRLYIKLQPWAKEAILSTIEGGIGYQYLKLYNPNKDMFISNNNSISQNNLYVYAGVGGKLKKYFNWDGYGKYHFAGYNINDFEIRARGQFSFYPFKEKKDGIHLTAIFGLDNSRPDYYSNNYYSNHYVWNNNFNKITTTKIEGQLDIPKWKMSAFFGYALLSNYVYYDTLGIIRQSTDKINVMSAYLQKNFKVWHLHFDNQILFQLSSKQDVLPLPMLSLHLRYYFEFVVVKNAMTMQIGADATFNTAYHAPAYNPATGAFQIQNKELVGNCPYIDVFANIQWKRASIFLKFTNAGQGWPTADYFSAYQYIKPKRAFKVGIHWPFYIH